MTHPEMVQKLIKSGEVIKESLTAEDCCLIHDGMGVVGEAGELLDAIKVKTIYRKDLDLDNVIEELGDLEFFMEDLRRRLGITREQTLRANMEKLGKRYGGFVYTDKAAQTRADKA